MTNVQSTFSGGTVNEGEQFSATLTAEPLASHAVDPISIPPMMTVGVWIVCPSSAVSVEALRTLQEDENADIDDVMDTMAGVMADCLSNNLNGVKVEPEQLENYDIEEMTAFIEEYRLCPLMLYQVLLFPRLFRL